MPRRPMTFPNLDPAQCVVGPSGQSFHCPDLATLDGHLKSLCKKIRIAGSDEAVKAYREDFDALLERRLFLQLTAG